MNQQLILKFKNHLKTKKLSKVSVKNYLSDLRQFLNWTANNNVDYFSPFVFTAYKSYLLKTKIPLKSINRYLSSLRCFGRFLKEKESMMINPAKNLTNTSNGKFQKFTTNKQNTEDLHIKKFKEALLKERLKPATIKNYLADVKQFLQFLNEI